MSQDDELSEQQFGMETRKLEIRHQRGIYLIDITPAKGSKSLVAVIFLKQLSLRQRANSPKYLNAHTSTCFPFAKICSGLIARLPLCSSSSKI